MYRICVTGGHASKEFELVFDVLGTMLQNYPKNEVIIINGGAKGIDAFAKIWAEDNDYEIETHPADWDKYGKAAGPVRNEYMLSLGIDVLIVFPGSRGTAHMKRICENHNKNNPESFIYIYDVRKEWLKEPDPEPIEGYDPVEIKITQTIEQTTEATDEMTQEDREKLVNSVLAAAQHMPEFGQIVGILNSLKGIQKKDQEKISKRQSSDGATWQTIITGQRGWEI